MIWEGFFKGPFFVFKSLLFWFLRIHFLIFQIIFCITWKNVLKQYCFDTFSTCESNFLHVESKHPKNVQKKVQKKATKLVKNGSQQEFKKGPTQTLRWRQLVIKGFAATGTVTAKFWESTRVFRVFEVLWWYWCFSIILRTSWARSVTIWMIWDKPRRRRLPG